MYFLRIVMLTINTLKPRQNGRHFADDTFKCIFLNENVWIPITIWLEFVPKGPINNIPALVQIRPWRRPGDKPLSESMMVSLPAHICVTRPQWVNRMEPNAWVMLAFAPTPVEILLYHVKQLSIKFVVNSSTDVNDVYNTACKYDVDNVA